MKPTIEQIYERHGVVTAQGTSEGAKKGWETRPKGYGATLAHEHYKCPTCRTKVHEGHLVEPTDRKLWDAGFSLCPNCKGKIHGEADAV